MTHFNAVKGVVTVGGTGNLTVSATAPARARALSVIPVSSVVPLRFDDPNGVDWEVSMCTILSATTLSRDTVLCGSNGTSKVNFATGTTVLQTVVAEQLNAFLTATSGVLLSDFLAASNAGAVSATDVLLGAQSSTAVGISANALALFAVSKYPSSRTVAVRITAAATIPLDFTTHHRRTIIVTVPGVTITGPSSYASVADDFECEIVNLSGGVVTLGTGIIGMPSGSTIAVGARCSVFSTGGAIYGSLGSAAAPDTVAPTVVSAAVSNAAPTVVRFTMSETMDSTKVPAASAFTIGGHTASSVAISGIYMDVTVSAAFANGEAARTAAYAQPGTNNARDLAGNLLANFSALAITNSVAAVAGGAAPFTVSARAGFPTARGTYGGGGSSNWTTDVAATGAATVVSVDYYLSESSSTTPVDSLSGATTPRGAHVVASQAGGGWYAASGIGLGFDITTPVNFYFWLRVTDSNGAVWWFRHTPGIPFSNSTAYTTSTAVASLPQV